MWHFLEQTKLLSRSFLDWVLVTKIKPRYSSFTEVLSSTPLFSLNELLRSLRRLNMDNINIWIFYFLFLWCWLASSYPFGTTKRLRKRLKIMKNHKTSINWRDFFFLIICDIELMILFCCSIKILVGSIFVASNIIFFLRPEIFVLFFKKKTTFNLNKEKNRFLILYFFRFWSLHNALLCAHEWPHSLMKLLFLSVGGLDANWNSYCKLKTGAVDAFSSSTGLIHDT